MRRPTSDGRIKLRLSGSRGGYSKPPLRQGDLDGLCGIYAIVNAIRLLTRTSTTAGEADLFEKLLDALDELETSYSELAVWGTPKVVLDRLVIVALEHVSTFHDTKLRAYSPGPRMGGHGLRAIWTTLRSAVASDRVAIVGIEGRHSHWTVVARVSEKSLILYDSSHLRRINRRDCGTGRRGRHNLNLRDVVLIAAS